MRINHNIAALNTYRQLSANTVNTSRSLEKLSSGLRINRAGDDAAGLAISEKMRSQIRGLDTAARNANDGISLIQTAEGALNETHSILQRMKELAVQAANDTNTDADRAEIQKEIEQLKTEITRIAEQTEFNTKKLLDGSMSIVEGKLPEGINSVSASGDAKGTFTITATPVVVEGDFDGTIAIADSATPAAGIYTITFNSDGTVDAVTLKGGDGTNLLTTHFDITPTGSVYDDTDVVEFEVVLEGKASGGEVGVENISVVLGSSVTSGQEFTVTIDTGKAMKFHIGANSGQNTSLSINNTLCSLAVIAACMPATPPPIMVISLII